MREMATELTPAQAWFTDKILMGYSVRGYLRSLATPANAIAAAILAAGTPVIIYRFVYGLGVATNLSQASPWGLWIGLDVLSGVAQVIALNRDGKLLWNRSFGEEFAAFTTQGGRTMSPSTRTNRK